MIAPLQRVARARVEIAGATVDAIDAGLLMLVCAEPSDTETVADRLVAKVLKLRIFGDARARGAHPATRRMNSCIARAWATVSKSGCRRLSMRWRRLCRRSSSPATRTTCST
ncbi:MAG: D-aminoacyl-tRNA deacylase [Caldimonas sp.]